MSDDVQTRVKALDEAFCSSCGAIIKRAAEICPKCGVRRKAASRSRKWLILLLLSICLGYLGADRFYVGKNSTAILKLITCGGAGIWYIIDLIFIFSGTFTDSEGNVISEYM